MNKLKATTLLTMLTMTCLFLAYNIYAQTTAVSITNYGTIGTIGAIAVNVTDLQWGTLYPAGSAIRSILVTSKGNQPQSLNMTASAWIPLNASSYITLTWDAEGKVLNKYNDSLMCNFTLAIHPDISSITSFSFNITITATT